MAGTRRGPLRVIGKEENTGTVFDLGFFPLPITHNP
jgi:hypothetical protein